VIDRKKITAVIDEYCRAITSQDKQGWLDLFADGIRHEDPVNVRVNLGKAQLAAFWDTFVGLDIELSLTAPVIVCGNEAVAFMRSRLGPVDSRKEMAPVIDILVFDDAGRITSVRAFYEQEWW
jgi:steroid Delta-isomerase